ncbi:MAG TPA: hypothetical protein VGI46_20365 [Candidatus Acidoferrum sp.]
MKKFRFLREVKAPSAEPDIDLTEICENIFSCVHLGVDRRRIACSLSGWPRLPLGATVGKPNQRTAL